MLRVQDICRSFGRKQVLQGVSFALESQTLAGLIGPSGGGKSVLLKIIGGVGRAGSGTISHGLSSDHERSLMFQEGALFDSMTVFDNVAFSLVGGRLASNLIAGSLRDEVVERVSAVLARVGLTRAAFKFPAQISGGMRRRASLARAVVARPKLLLLDDPTSGLDPVASSVIMELIVEMHKEYKPTTLIVSHDLRRLLPVVQQIVALFQGVVAFSGSVAQIGQDAPQSVREFVSCRYDLVPVPPAEISP